MKDKWTNDIKDRMKSFELPEPEGLWDRIENKLDEETVVPVRKTPVRILSRRILDAVAIAAAILAFIYLGGSFDTKLPDLSTPLVGGVIDKAETDIKPEQTESSPEPRYAKISNLPPARLATAFSAKKRIGVSEAAQNAEKQSEIKPDETAPNIVAEDTAKTVISEPAAHTPTDRNPGDYSRRYATSELGGLNKKKRSSKGIQLNLYANGGNNLSNSTRPNFRGGNTSYAYDGNSGSGVELGSGMILGKSKQEASASYISEENHHLPVRIGISAAYPLTERISIEAGVNYTNLTTDRKNGNVSNYNASKQELHYIGIPVNVKFRAYSWRALDFYASAGVMGEKCIDGHIREHIIVNDKETQTNTENIHIKQLQWSVNAGAGIQCNLTNHIGLYAEPGVSYFFNDGSSVRTIYKDKPWNFNLNLGLRLNLGR